MAVTPVEERLVHHTQCPGHRRRDALATLDQPNRFLLEVDRVARPHCLLNFPADLDPKRRQLLKQMAPGLTRVAVLANLNNPYHATVLQTLEPFADQIGLRILPVSTSTPEVLEPAFRAMAQQRADAVRVIADVYLWSQGSRIAEMALKARLPSMFAYGNAVEAGSLMSYGVDGFAPERQVATYVDRMFKGAKPGDLPIEQPTRLDLVINRKTANALHLTIPQAPILQAERVIE